MESDLLPNFIIIGAMKSATSSLYQYCVHHPEIGMSKKKETDYFTDRVYPNVDLDWYKDQFVGTETCTIRGEASTNYTKRPKFEGIPKLIHKILPETKLIYIMRDPLERMVSQLNMMHHFEHFDNLESFISEYQHFIECSLYNFQLSPYLEYFSKERFLLITAEELKLDRTSTMKKVYRFLEVDEDFEHENLQKEYHVRRQGPVPSSLYERIISSSLKDPLKKICPNFLVEYTKNKLSIAPPKASLSPQLENQLKEQFKEDTKELTSWYNFDTSHWKSIQ